MNLEQKGFNAFLYSYGAVFLEKFFNIISSIIIINFLVVEEYGVYSIFQSLLVLFLSFAFGIPKVINRYYPEFEQNEDWTSIRTLLKYTIFSRLLLSSLICIAVYFSIPELIILFNISVDFIDDFRLFSILVFFHINVNTLVNILLAKLDYKIVQISRLIMQFFQVCLIYYLLRMDYGVLGIVITLLFTNVILSIFYSFFVLKFTSTLPRNKSINSFPSKRLIRYGGIYFSITIFGFILTYSTDIFFISHYSNSTDVGFYSFAVKLVAMIFSASPVVAFQAIFTNLLIRKNSKELDMDNLKSSISTYYKFIFFFNIPLLIISYCFAEKIIIFFFRDEYLASLEIFYLSLFLSIFMMIQLPLHPLIKVIEKPEILLYTFIFAFIKIILSFYLIPKYNLYGAVFSTGISWFLTTIFLIAYLKRKINFTFPWLTLTKFTINGLIIFPVLLFFESYIGNIWHLVFVTLFSLLVYLFACFLNKGFNNEERDTINEVTGKKLFLF